MFDGKAFGAEIVGIVKGHIERSLAPLSARIEALERALANLPVPKDGEPGTSVTLDDVAPMVKAAIDDVVADIPRAMAQAIEDEIAKLPPAVDGKDADPDLIKQMVTEAVAALPPAEKGKDADPAQVEELVVQHVERVLAGWERPKDGAPGENGADGTPGLNGKDGIDAMDVMVDREGQLVFTMSDGRMKNVGLVIGKDGEPGRDGVNGAPGKDGVDGVGFDDLDLIENDAGVFLRCVRGENVKEWRLPVMRYRGVFKDGQVYRKGDTVTWGGSLWHCDADGTDDKPDGPTKSWTLASKRGRDGKDGGTK